MVIRLPILASSIPLLVLGYVTGMPLQPPQQPCLHAGNVALQITSSPWQAQMQVSFTESPSEASVRVQIVDAVGDADFAVVEDAPNSGQPATCSAGERRLVAISPTPDVTRPIIYLSRSEPADHRVFVSSDSFTAHDAAALVVAADTQRKTISNLAARLAEH